MFTSIDTLTSFLFYLFCAGSWLLLSITYGEGQAFQCKRDPVLFFFSVSIVYYILIYNLVEARLEAILSSFSISRSDQRFRKLLGLRKEVKKETSHKEPIKKYYASKGYSI